ncbi:MAG TPA: DNRLRE domain-containing protein [Allosphingosinicella sp.]|nr:DNRLRE domain-containing protein [Allosphingosinicella sp.]
MSARSLLLWLILLAGVLCPATARAGSYTVNSNGDSWINEASINQNNGTVTTLRATASSTNTSRTRSVIKFTLPAIPSNEAITAATLKLNVTTSSTRTVTVHRLTASWTETGVTWGNFNGNFNATAEASFTPSATGSVSIDVTALVQGWAAGTNTNNGLGLIGAASSTAIFASEEATTVANRPQLVITTALISPSITVVKSTSVVSDPFNGTSNPKMIPGATVRYTIQASNSTAGTADSNSTQFTDAVPAGMKLYVGDVGSAGSGPVGFANDATSSGLTYAFVSLASTTDSLSFSNNGGSTFAYTPVPDSSGADANVTHVRISPTGTFAGKTGAGTPGLTLQMLMLVK